MPAQPFKGGSKVIEEIAVKVALPSLTRLVTQSPDDGAAGMPGRKGRRKKGTAAPDSTFPEGVAADLGGPAPEGQQAEAGVEVRALTLDDIELKGADVARMPGQLSDLPPLPQQQVTVLKLEDLDFDAPPMPDEGKLDLADIPPSQIIQQVFVMTEEQIIGGSGAQAPPPDGKENGEKKPGPAAGAATGGAPQIQQIYTVDPNVIKRLQWRLARMEDFETSMGLAIQEIKEAIAKMETTRIELEEMRKGYGGVEKTMHELAALYDLISASVNPFIDSEDEQKTISTKIMKRNLGMTDDFSGSSASSSTGPSAFTASSAFEMPEAGKKKGEEKGEDYSIDTWTVKWAEFLLERVPKSKIPALLDHYIEIGWLDEEVKARIEETIKGISEIDLGITMPEGDESDEDKKKLDWWKLPIDDHVKSLQMIEKIRGGKPPAAAMKM